MFVSNLVKTYILVAAVTGDSMGLAAIFGCNLLTTYCQLTAASFGWTALDCSDYPTLQDEILPSKASYILVQS